jgi:protocatechuate 3,4-dioxygenase beta subunit
VRDRRVLVLPLGLLTIGLLSLGLLSLGSGPPTRPLRVRGEGPGGGQAREEGAGVSPAVRLAVPPGAPPTSGADALPAPPTLQTPPASGEPHGLGALEVVVVDGDGRPIPGAEVALAAPSEERIELMRESTDARGRVGFPAVPAREVHVTARGEGYEDGRTWLEVLPGGSHAVRVVLLPEVRVAVLVLAESDGSPVAGASVRVGRGGSANGRAELVGHGMEPREVGVTDALGRALIRVGRNAIQTIEAAAPGLGTRGGSVSRMGTGPEVVLRLPPEARLTGLVRTLEGGPAAGARLWIVPAGVPDLLRNPDLVVGPGRSWLEASEVGMATMEVDEEGEIHRARRLATDGEGRFDVGALAPPLSLVVLAEGADGSRATSPRVALTAQEPVARIELHLGPRSTLRVHVRGPDGGDVSGEVRLEGVGETFAEATGPGVREEAAGAGRPARFPGLGAGTYRLVVRIRGAVPVVREVAMPAAGTLDLTVRGEPGRTVEGSVVDGAGRPLAGAAVQCWDQGEVGSHASAQTDEEGRFRLSGLTPGAPWTLRAEAAGHVPGTAAAGASEDGPLRLVLLARPRLTGRLVLADGMTPRPYLWVGEGGPCFALHRTAEVGRDGTFRYALEHVDEECVVVLLPWEGADRVLGRFRLGPEEAQDVGAIHVEAGRTVRGRVVDARGGPVAGAVVVVEHPLARGIRDSFVGSREVATDAAGRFERDRVHAGPAVVTVRVGEGPPVEVTEDGGGGDLLVRLP